MKDHNEIWKHKSEKSKIKIITSFLHYIVKVVTLLVSHTRIWGDNGQMWWAFIKVDVHIFELFLQLSNVGSR